MKATGHGLKHFFGARESRHDLKTMGKQVKQSGTKLRKAEVMAAMGMYAIYKGSPIGLAKNLYGSIREGAVRYGDLKKHQVDLDDFLAQTGMSDEGKRAVASMVQRGGSDAEVAHLSPRDLAEFKQLRTDMYAAAGQHININADDFRLFAED